MAKWSLTSWQNFTYEQAATYPDEAQLARVVEQLSQLPLLSPAEKLKI